MMKLGMNGILIFRYVYFGNIILYGYLIGVNKHVKLNSDIISMSTWEAILDYLYNHKTIQECVNFHTWEYNREILTIKENIKKKYLKTLK
jgi:hypothetical protein